MATEETIKQALQSVKYPGFSRDIFSFGLVREVVHKGSEVQVSLQLTTSNPDVPEKIKADVESAVGALDGIDKVTVGIDLQQPKRTAQQQAASAAAGSAPEPRTKDVRFIVAVASGKGGVGKSTFAVNLSCAFKQLQKEGQLENGVGLLDCDVHGPSVPLMMGVNQRPEVGDDVIHPVENYGIRLMSMGLLVDENTPVVWRGPMVTSAISQFVNHVEWGSMDVLVVDLPPGTGDAQLSLAQTLPLAGAVIVTTPQAAASTVAARGAGMFEKVNVPLLGVAENMSYLENPETGEKQYIFGQGGGEKAATALKTSFLGQIPLDTRIREGGDRGVPIVLADPESPAAQAFVDIARNIWQSLVKQ